ncbi:PadR family transcriptional regulator [Paramicrobacterium chengjingii]|uniref:Helix-turn-helix transcriptional regulator n=1 Tax=Paramicrobacterium chengjingii TaxID=2769067 RepID=A0ABX6YFZ0_9MICO|nr:PadR family transcriptional regulator [Microbacterium chengjingii]QPZ37692.1 helix-turn-helix transcriptional regulator [Microbacterium chengjingii]
MTPVFAHGNLRLYLLKLLAESPRNGYEIIQALSERFGGTYSPSAGTVYPRLAKLAEEGLVAKNSDGRKSVYEITDAGRAELERRADELDAIEDEVSDSVRRLADEVRTGVTDAMRSLRAELASAARDARSRAQDDPVSTPRDTDSRTQSRVAVYEIESAVSEFRRELRSDLRNAIASGKVVDDQLIVTARSELARVRELLRPR